MRNAKRQGQIAELRGTSTTVYLSTTEKARRNASREPNFSKRTTLTTRDWCQLNWNFGVAGAAAE